MYGSDIPFGDNTHQPRASTRQGSEPQLSLDPLRLLSEPSSELQVFFPGTNSFLDRLDLPVWRIPAKSAHSAGNSACQQRCGSGAFNLVRLLIQGKNFDPNSK
jgi:hypothetical protein